MAVSQSMNTTQLTNHLRTVYDSDFSTAPTEESVVAGYVAQPIGAQKIGNKLYLRKIAALSAGKYSGTSGLPQNLTAGGLDVQDYAQTALSYAYAMLELDENAMTRILDDGNFRTALKKQMLAAVNTTLDADIFALAATLSHTQSVADLNDATVQAALGDLATYAKGKFRLGETPVTMFIHPSEVKNALAVSTFKEYQIRGTQGAAANGSLNGYGISVRESGNVYQNGGNTYNALVLPEAWALGYNIKPSFLPEQQDGIVTRLIVRAEYGVCEWWDELGVAVITT